MAVCKCFQLVKALNSKNMSISRRRTPPWAAAVFVLLAWSSALCSTHAAGEDARY